MCVYVLGRLLYEYNALRTMQGCKAILQYLIHQ